MATLNNLYSDNYYGDLIASKEDKHRNIRAEIYSTGDEYTLVVEYLENDANKHLLEELSKILESYKNENNLLSSTYLDRGYLGNVRSLITYIAPQDCKEEYLDKKPREYDLEISPNEIYFANLMDAYSQIYEKGLIVEEEQTITKERVHPYKIYTQIITKTPQLDENKDEQIILNEPIPSWIYEPTTGKRFVEAEQYKAIERKKLTEAKVIYVLKENGYYGEEVARAEVELAQKLGGRYIKIELTTPVEHESVLINFKDKLF